MNRPTGEQLEIASGDARAVVTELGAALRSFSVAGVPYTETYGAGEVPPVRGAVADRYDLVQLDRGTRQSK